MSEHVNDINTVEEHLRPGQVAARLNVHVITVLRWIAIGRASKGRRGIYPVRHPSPKITLIPASAVNRFLLKAE
ncbi:MAG: hypothetical protein PHR77_13655 [Kiritimatiellae bacterium]|nr:hypothetical protein [Kiritimatiellia bacterium]MDD5520730.1 hypothetical protein [Kiritimatiellia bacterium]